MSDWYSIVAGNDGCNSQLTCDEMSFISDGADDNDEFIDYCDKDSSSFVQEVTEEIEGEYEDMDGCAFIEVEA